MRDCQLDDDREPIPRRHGPGHGQRSEELRESCLASFNSRSAVEDLGRSGELCTVKNGKGKNSAIMTLCMSDELIVSAQRPRRNCQLLDILDCILLLRLNEEHTRIPPRRFEYKSFRQSSRILELTVRKMLSLLGTHKGVAIASRIQHLCRNPRISFVNLLRTVLYEPAISPPSLLSFDGFFFWP